MRRVPRRHPHIVCDAAYVEGIIRSLSPRDDLELAQASRIVRYFLQYRRIGVLEAETLAGDTSDESNLVFIATIDHRSLDDVGRERAAYRALNSAPYHPQTLGKLERFHRTLKEWLRDEGPVFDVEHLQELLDGFRFHYNRQRPHQGIGDATPAERYATEAIPNGTIGLPGPEEISEPVYPPYSFVRKVGSSGNVGFRGKLIQVGSRWAGARVRVVEVERLVHIYHGDNMIRVLTIDPDHYYQPKKEKEAPIQRTVT